MTINSHLTYLLMEAQAMFILMFVATPTSFMMQSTIFISNLVMLCQTLICVIIWQCSVISIIILQQNYNLQSFYSEIYKPTTCLHQEPFHLLYFVSNDISKNPPFSTTTFSVTCHFPLHFNCIFKKI